MVFCVRTSIFCAQRNRHRQFICASNAGIILSFLDDGFLITYSSLYCKLCVYVESLLFFESRTLLLSIWFWKCSDLLLKFKICITKSELNSSKMKLFRENICWNGAHFSSFESIIRSEFILMRHRIKKWLKVMTDSE